MNMLEAYLLVGFILSSGLLMSLLINEGKELLHDSKDAFENLLTAIFFIPFWFPVVFGIVINEYKNTSHFKLSGGVDTYLLKKKVGCLDVIHYL